MSMNRGNATTKKLSSFVSELGSENDLPPTMGNRGKENPRHAPSHPAEAPDVNDEDEEREEEEEEAMDEVSDGLNWPWSTARFTYYQVSTQYAAKSKSQQMKEFFDYINKNLGFGAVKPKNNTQPAMTFVLPGIPTVRSNTSNFSLDSIRTPCEKNPDAPITDLDRVFVALPQGEKPDDPNANWRFATVTVTIEDNPKGDSPFKFKYRTDPISADGVITPAQISKFFPYAINASESYQEGVDYHIPETNITRVVTTVMGKLDTTVIAPWTHPAVWKWIKDGRPDNMQSGKKPAPKNAPKSAKPNEDHDVVDGDDNEDDVATKVSRKPVAATTTKKGGSAPPRKTTSSAGVAESKKTTTTTTPRVVPLKEVYSDENDEGEEGNREDDEGDAELPIPESIAQPIEVDPSLLRRKRTAQELSSSPSPSSALPSKPSTTPSKQTNGHAKTPSATPSKQSNAHAKTPVAASSKKPPPSTSVADKASSRAPPPPQPLATKASVASKKATASSPPAKKARTEPQETDLEQELGRIRMIREFATEVMPKVKAGLEKSGKLGDKNRWLDLETESIPRGNPKVVRKTYKPFIKLLEFVPTLPEILEREIERLSRPPEKTSAREDEEGSQAEDDDEGYAMDL